MHVYSVNSEARETVTKILVSIDIVFACFICPVIQESLINLLIKYVGDSANMIMIILTSLMPVGVYGILRWLFNHVLWKWKVLITWHHIPDLHGRWYGTITSPLKEQVVNVQVDIRQTWTEISISTTTNSKAHSESAMIEIADRDKIFLRYAFANERRGQPSYLGYNCLELRNNILSGEYFTAKDIGEEGKGSKGFFEIQKEMN